MATALLQLNLAYLASFLYAAQATTRRMVKDDRGAHLADMAKQANAAAAKHDLRAFARCQRELVPKPPKKLLALKDEEGKYLKTPLEIRQRWRRYFSAQPCGEVVEEEELLRANIAAQRDLFRQLAALSHSVDIEDIPSLKDTRALLQTVPANRAFGEDCIPGDALKVALGEVSRAMHLLFFKSIVRLEEPMQWKGGLLAELSKAGG